MKRLENLLGSFLRGLWLLVSSYPSLIVIVGVGLAVLSILASSARLRLDSDQNSLVSARVPFHKRYLHHLQNFGDQEYFYVVIETGGSEKGGREAEGFAETVANQLQKHPDLIQALYYKISAKDFGDKALLFATPQEAKALSQMVSFLAPYLDAWRQNGRLPDLLATIAELLSGRSNSPVDLGPALFGRSLEMLREFLKNMENVAVGREKPNDYRLLKFGDAGTHYFFTSNNRLLIMRILPKKNFQTLDVVEKPLQAVRSAMQIASRKFPGVRAGLTGRPVLQADEMQTTDKDMTRASIFAIVLIGMLFMLILRGWLRPALIVMSLVLAIAWTFGFTTVTLGRLNLLSVVFTLVLVGIGVDFGVHVMLRYVEARKGGDDIARAVQTSIYRIGPGIILGALTSVCAFYSVLNSDFRGLAELGLIGGTGILLSLLAMLTVLPSLLLIVDKSRISSSRPVRAPTLTFMDRLSARPVWLLIVLGVFSMAALPGLSKLHFSYNLLELQARGLESVEYERRLIDDTDESTWYAIMTTPSVDAIPSIVTELQKLPSVGKVESILSFIPSEQAQKADLYASAAAALEGIPHREPNPSEPTVGPMVDALNRLAFALGDIEEKLFAAGAVKEIGVIGDCLHCIESLQRSVQNNHAGMARLAQLQTDLNRDVENSLQQLERLLSARSVTPGDIPPSIRDLFVGKDGSYQIKIAPRINVWNFDKLRQFVGDLREIDPNVSGVPVGVMESAQLMHRTFLSAAGLTIFLVSFILWLYSRSITYVMLTLLPLGVGILWLLELMGWAGLSFNLANFFAIPVLIAIGVDGGVHLLARWRELHDRQSLFSTSTPTAVSLSYATTMIGFGGLLFAHHRGLASLGAVMVLGSLTCLIACLLVLPTILKLFGSTEREGGRQANVPMAEADFERWP